MQLVCNAAGTTLKGAKLVGKKPADHTAAQLAPWTQGLKGFCTDAWAAQMLSQNLNLTWKLMQAD